LAFSTFHRVKRRARTAAFHHGLGDISDLPVEQPTKFSDARHSTEQLASACDVGGAVAYAVQRQVCIPCTDIMFAGRKP
jgi:hypothetical protein